MTDSEIIKALEYCAQPIPICKECPCYDPHVPYPCADQLKWAALNLIDSQKAEIEKLNTENQSLRSAATSYKIHYNKARAEAVREFAEKLKNNLTKNFLIPYVIVSEIVDNTLKEMVGDTE